MPKPAKKKNKNHLYLFCSICAVIVILSLSSFNFERFLAKQKVLGTQTEIATQNALTEQILFWEKLVSENPTYRDGWLELGKLYEQAGQSDKGTAALLKARQIDPNYSAF